MKVNINLKLIDEEKNILETRAVPFNSFLFKAAHLYYIAARLISSTTNNQIMNTQGNLQTIDNSGNYFCGLSLMPFDDGIGEDRWGIVVGKGTTPVDMHDYKLDDQIFDGNDPGELLHSGYQFKLEDDYEENDIKCIAERSFTNESGDDVIITEIALYAVTQFSENWGSGAHNRTICVARDVLDQSIIIPHDKTLEVIYTIELPL